MAVWTTNYLSVNCGALVHLYGPQMHKKSDHQQGVWASRSQWEGPTGFQLGFQLENRRIGINNSLATIWWSVGNHKFGHQNFKLWSGSSSKPSRRSQWRGAMKSEPRFKTSNTSWITPPIPDKSATVRLLRRDKGSPKGIVTGEATQGYAPEPAWHCDGSIGSCCSRQHSCCFLWPPDSQRHSEILCFY